MNFGTYSQTMDPTLKRVYADLLDELREQVVFSEEAGFEHAWVDEHHFNPTYVNLPNSLMPGAMLSACTSRIRLGQCDIVGCWQPLRLAEDIALLDHMSKGRVDVAFGRGFSAFDVANINPQLQGIWPEPGKRFEKSHQTNSRAHFAEVVQILKKAWTEDFFSHEGTFYKFPPSGFPSESSIVPTAPPSDPTAAKDGEIVKMRLEPKPYQKPYPPLWQLMTSEPSFTEAAQLGLKGMTWIQPPRRLRQRFQTYYDIRTAQEGRQFRLGEDVGALRMTFVAPSYEEAKRDADQFFTPYIARACRSRPQSYYMDEGEEVNGDVELNWELFIKQNLILAGSPEQVAEQIHELNEKSGLEYFMLWMEAGGISHKKVMSSLDLFASKVAPLFANGGRGN